MDAQHAELMTTFPMFQDYTARGTQSLIERGQIREFAPGDLLFKEGEPAKSVLLILTGKAEVFVETEGNEVGLTNAGPSRMLGELAVLGGIRRPASARAAVPTAAIEWDGKAFRRLISSDIDFSQRIFRELIRELAEDDRALAASLNVLRDGAES